MKNTNPDFESVVKGVVCRMLQYDQTNQQSIMESMSGLLSAIEPIYQQQDNFTVAVLVNKNDKTFRCLGVSKRNLEDPKNPLRGKALALSRAIRAYCLM
jgi:mevalonate kinase